ncbi:hypothetical protein HQN90_16590 [Paenibacillus alba]|nr:hypothetical protein [Paenibacillus alba]
MHVLKRPKSRSPRKAELSLPKKQAQQIKSSNPRLSRRKRQARHQKKQITPQNEAEPVKKAGSADKK